MTQEIAVRGQTEVESGKETAIEEFVTVRVGSQLFGVSVYVVQDILRWQNITHIPLSPPEIAGALNLRGRIVTAVDIRRRLGLPPADPMRKPMNVVVEIDGNLYSLVVDSVGEVMNLDVEQIEQPPSTMEHSWIDVAVGVSQLKEELLVLLDVRRLLGLNQRDPQDDELEEEL